MGKKDGKKHLILAENRNLSANSLYNFILRKALKKRKMLYQITGVTSAVMTEKYVINM